MTLNRLAGGGQMPTGSILQYAVSSAPTDWLLCDGTNTYDRTSYANLFNTIMPSKGSFTITIASPAVVTLNGHGLVEGDQVVLSTTGALPTGLTADTVNYYVKSPTTNTFNLSASRTSSGAGTAINTSGTQSGTHTLYYSPYGKGSSSATFAVPDLRGKIAVGSDTLNGSDAGNLSVINALGWSSGEENHTLTIAEMPAHSHGVSDPTHAHYVYTGAVAYANGVQNAGAGNIAGGTTDAQPTNLASGNVGNTGSGTAHNNMQPYILTSYIIKT